MPYLISSILLIALVISLVYMSAEHRKFNDHKKAKMREFDFEEWDAFK